MVRRPATSRTRPRLALGVSLLAGCSAGASTSAPTGTSVTTEVAPSTGGSSSGTVGASSTGAPTTGAPTTGDPTTHGGSTNAAGSTGGSTGEAPPPVTALLQIVESTALLSPTIVANSGFQDLYAASLDVLPDDVLRVHGQGEMTNDHTDPVSGQIQLVRDGAPIGTWAQQNAIQDQSHHMPLWADAIIVADAAATVDLRLQWRADRSDASPAVALEDGYGHLVVEHYRSFPSLAEAEAAGALLLADSFSSAQALVTSFGPEPSVAAEVYAATLEVAAGDRLRLGAQVTTTFAGAIEMQGQQIRADGLRVSPWSTSNAVAPMPDLPLWTDAVDLPGAAGVRSYSAAVHGVAGNGGGVLGSHGGLHGLRFSAAPAGARSYLDPSVDETAAPAQVVANAPALELLARPLTLAAGDVVRLTAAVQLLQPADFPDGVSCGTQLVLVDAGEQAIASTSATKYVTALLAGLPLRGEVIAEAPSAGDYTARYRVQCAREGADPTVPAPKAWLLVERFGAP